jgi:ribosome modulation factor
MDSQLHIIHRAAYLAGWKNGENDALADRDYRPRDGATGTEGNQLAYGLGYCDGWANAMEDGPVSPGR